MLLLIQGAGKTLILTEWGETGTNFLEDTLVMDQRTWLTKYFDGREWIKTLNTFFH